MNLVRLPLWSGPHSGLRPLVPGLSSGVHLAGNLGLLLGFSKGGKVCPQKAPVWGLSPEQAQTVIPAMCIAGASGLGALTVGAAVHVRTT